MLLLLGPMHRTYTLHPLSLHQETLLTTGRDQSLLRKLLHQYLHTEDLLNLHLPSRSLLTQRTLFLSANILQLAYVVYSQLSDLTTIIRASVDALCRDGTSEISRDPRTKRLQTRRESLAMPSKHTNNNF